jgi:hypothetical protein
MRIMNCTYLNQLVAVGNVQSFWAAWKNVMNVKKWKEDGSKGLCRFEQFEVGSLDVLL